MLAGLILALLVWLFLVPVLSGGRVWLPTRLLYWLYPFRASTSDTPPPWNPLMWDGVAQFGVWRLYAAKVWNEGYLPLWNPHQGAGYPLYANSQSAVFYPPNVLFAWLGAAAFGWLAGWHLWWAGMGTWLLLRRQVGVSFGAAMVGAVAFAFSLWMVTWQYLPTLPATASWIPWVISAASAWLRSPSVRHATLWGAAMGFCLLAGHLQIAFYALLAGVLLVAYHVMTSVLKSALAHAHLRRGLPARPVATFSLAFVIALSLSAPQVLPAVELSSYSHRRAPATTEGYSAYVRSAMPVAHLATLFLPDFFGHPGVPQAETPDTSTYWGKGNYAEFACFMGVPALLLAAFGALGRYTPWRGYALLLAVLAMLLALGTPLNAAFYFGVPGFSATGSPARVLVLWAFAIALLSAIGANQLAHTRRRDWVVATVALFALFGVAMLSARVTTVGALGEEAFAELWRLQTPVLAQGIALAILAVGAVLFGQKRGWKPLFPHAVMVLCVLGSLWSAGVGYNPTAPPQSVYPVTPLIERLQSLSGDHWRVFAVQEGWSLYRAPQAILPPNLSTVLGLYDLQIYDSLMPLHTKRWLDELNGRDSAPVENGNMALGWRAPVEKLAKVGVRYVVAAQPLAQGGLDLVFSDSEGNIYEVAGAHSWVRTSEGQPCNFRWQGGNRLEVRIPQATTALHVLQTFYPGWRVEPAGVIVPLDGVFQRVEVPTGAQSVRLKFEPQLLRISLYIALVALAVTIACWAGCRRGESEKHGMI